MLNVLTPRLNRVLRRHHMMLADGLDHRGLGALVAGFLLETHLVAHAQAREGTIGDVLAWK